MTWFGYTLLAIYAVSTIINISWVGKPRQPLTAGTAAFLTVYTALIVWGILAVGTGSL